MSPISSKRKALLRSLLDTTDSDYSPVKGVHYFDGASGSDGREIELRKANDSIQWHYIGTDEWYTLVYLEDITGEQGPQGEQGEQGFMGAKGPQGEVGPVGPEGRKLELHTSDTHLQWGYADEGKWYNIIALKDIQGPKGEPGTDGRNGDTGPEGSRGEPGPVGATGERGERGPEGKRGLRGPSGKDGADGKPGERGEKGDKGDRGESGLPGTDGKRGPKGEKGDKPILGVDYFIINGANGRDGRPGRDGLDGTGGGGDSMLSNSTYTYSDGLVTRIDYADGQYKTFVYNPDSTVSTIVWFRLTDTVTKIFSYNPDATLASVNITIT